MNELEVQCCLPGFNVAPGRLLRGDSRHADEFMAVTLPRMYAGSHCGEQAVELPLHHRVALANARLQPGTIEDGDWPRLSGKAAVPPSGGGCRLRFAPSG